MAMVAMAIVMCNNKSNGAYYWHNGSSCDDGDGDGY